MMNCLRVKIRGRLPLESVMISISCFYCTLRCAVLHSFFRAAQQLYSRGVVFTSLVKSSVQYNSPTGLDSYWEQGSRMGFTKRNSFPEDCVRYRCECLTHLSVHLWIVLAYTKQSLLKLEGSPSVFLNAVPSLS